MAFQPFGFRFTVRSSLSADDLKAAIRARRTRWFDPKNGARGWIIGPIVCLWWSGLNPQGPMLLGKISRKDGETWVRGRAGSDLNGIAATLLTGIATIPLLCFILSSGNGLVVVGVLTAVLVLASATLVFRSAHANRKQAEPLVRFLEKAAGRQQRSPDASTN